MTPTEINAVVTRLISYRDMLNPIDRWKRDLLADACNALDCYAKDARAALSSQEDARPRKPLSDAMQALIGDVESQEPARRGETGELREKIVRLIREGAGAQMCNGPCCNDKRKSIADDILDLLSAPPSSRREGLEEALNELRCPVDQQYSLDHLPGEPAELVIAPRGWFARTAILLGRANSLPLPQEDGK